MQNTLQKLKESRWTSRLFSPVILVLLVLLFSVLTGGRFSNLRNLRMVVDQALVVATVASGAVFIFATGNVNISMGASTALIATIAAQMYIRTASVPVMCVVSVAAGVIALAITALLSTTLKVRVLYITVVMMTLLASMQQD